MLNTETYTTQDLPIMGECNIPLTYNSAKIEDKLCRLNYSSWCPTCDRESPRRRARSETNEPCRRKPKEMKTFTPKKYNKNTEYENMDLDYEICNYRPDCCRIRTNLCELPTTYITNNCQPPVQLSTAQKVTNGMSEWSVEYFDRNNRPFEGSIRVIDCSQPIQMSEKPKSFPKSEEYGKINGETQKVSPNKLEGYKSHYNVVPKQPVPVVIETRKSPPRNGFTLSTKNLELPKHLSTVLSPPKLSAPYSANKIGLPKAILNSQSSNALEQCAFDANTLYGPKLNCEDSRCSKNCISAPKVNQGQCSIIELKMPEQERVGLCYDTRTFFDKQYNSANIRERYHNEIESLRNRLREMRNNKHSLSNGPIIQQQYINTPKSTPELPKSISEIPKSTNEVEKQEQVEVSEEKPQESIEKPKDVKKEELTLNPIKLLPMVGESPSKPKIVTITKTVLKKNTEISPLSSRREIKTGVKITMRTKSKLSAVKLRKLRTKIPNSVSCSDSSDSTESECSDSEKSEKEEGVQEAESGSESSECRGDTKGRAPPKQSCPKSLNCLGSGDAKSPPAAWPIRESMFPHIPPYLNFNSHDAEAPFVVPPSGKRYFKWKLSTITPIVVRKTLANSGFRLVRKSNEWMGTWGKHMKSPMFKTLKDTQKLNHFPGTFQIGRKDRLWRNLQRLMHRFGQKEFGFIPHTYILPQELKLLKQNWEHKNGSGDEKWIIKPPASARGVGIRVINKWSQLPKKIALVVQQYIARPYLINGSKFDLRLYVLVTSFNPLRIYLWPDGLARFASAKYSEDSRSLKDRYMHLTNYSINKLSSQYTANEDANSCQGHKWTLSKLWEYMEGQGVDTKAIWKNLQDLVIKTILSGESCITPLCRENMNTRYNCYELFGIDVLLDFRLKPWLLEVNISPSLHSASPLDCHVKGPLVKSLFDLAQFHIPPRAGKGEETPPTYEPRIYTTALTKKERSKHTYYEQIETRDEYLEEILNDLTGDDVRHLTQAEDEFVAMGQFERIFPTQSSHSYLHFMESRYYNKLFDAWEQKYGNNRIAGIARLQKLCAEKIHLKVGQPSAINKSLLSMNLGELNLGNTKDGVNQQLNNTLNSTNLVEGTILRENVKPIFTNSI